MYRLPFPLVLVATARAALTLAPMPRPAVPSPLPAPLPDVPPLCLPSFFLFDIHHCSAIDNSGFRNYPSICCCGYPTSVPSLKNRHFDAADFSDIQRSLLIYGHIPGFLSHSSFVQLSVDHEVKLSDVGAFPRGVQHNLLASRRGASRNDNAV
jgi:hypothetical protein